MQEVGAAKPDTFLMLWKGMKGSYSKPFRYNVLQMFINILSLCEEWNDIETSEWLETNSLAWIVKHNIVDELRHLIAHDHLKLASQYVMLLGSIAAVAAKLDQLRISYSQLIPEDR